MLPERIEEAYKGQHGESQKAIARKAALITELLLRKNADYGDSAFKNPVLSPHLPVTTAIEVRMSDKIQRLSNLQNSNGEVAESIEDTMMDLIGYGILWLVSKDMDTKTT